mmetsp:Transcript_22541/g.31375  ORF Transcript_22541/g.31375 Transcript_22541/m.31375 type:complete len:272 (+) Transcript_22541:138-953(+)|eukprot:CAMPEP_0196587328 /NCGR_PEP_ID=MMETSP1081-20130531/57127_1 /TAXON_ID=36882 /ORGANISM="Pyramimonas amylifera, Strain CCMP720" /LENGTH=271 /DNA_ID=CAMNT_0041909483 /DNA_START=138 /DNA_END=953 /DNA_ORIENTATION=+
MSSEENTVCSGACLAKEEEELEEGEGEKRALLRPSPSQTKMVGPDSGVGGVEGGDCRICQEWDTRDNLDIPCVCAGSMLYAHPSCIARWIDEKGDRICEVCHTAFQGDYPPPPARPPRGDQASLSDQNIVRELQSMLETARAHTATNNDVEQMFLQRRSTSSHFMWVRLCIIVVMCWMFVRMIFSVEVPPDADASPEGDSTGNSQKPGVYLAFLIRFMFPLIPFLLMYQAIMAMRMRHQLQARANAAEISMLFREGGSRFNGPVVRVHNVV